MWHAARNQEKKVYKAMEEARKRAQDRQREYKSKLGDPNLLLRIYGRKCQTFKDAEQFYFQENTDNMSVHTFHLAAHPNLHTIALIDADDPIVFNVMKWIGDNETRIDRFDARALLDYLPSHHPQQITKTEDVAIRDELNFERYRDLVESERLGVSEEDYLAQIDEKWNEIVKRKDVDDPLMISTTVKKTSCKPNAAIPFQYESFAEPTVLQSNTYREQGQDSQTLQDSDDSDEEEAPIDMLELDLLGYVRNVSDEDTLRISNIGREYGIRNYIGQVKDAYRDRKVRKKNMKLLEEKRRRPSRRKRTRTGRLKRHENYSIYEDGQAIYSISETDESDQMSSTEEPRRRSGENSTYDPYYDGESSHSFSPSRGRNEPEMPKRHTEPEFITEFGIDLTKNQSPPSYSKEETDEEDIDWEEIADKKSSRQTSRTRSLLGNEVVKEEKAEKMKEKKLTMAERLKLKLRGQLEQQIKSDAQQQQQKMMEAAFAEVGLETALKMGVGVSNQNGVDKFGRTIRPIKSPSLVTSITIRSGSTSRSDDLENRHEKSEGVRHNISLKREGNERNQERVQTRSHRRQRSRSSARYRESRPISRSRSRTRRSRSRSPVCRSRRRSKSRSRERSRRRK